jgi:heme exporter protein CcmB
MAFLRHAWAVAWKDLRVELRTREILSTMVFFAAMIVIVCSFAFVEKVPSAGDLASGVLWVAVAFSGTIALQRAFEREREGQTIRGLLLAPSERSAIFLGKAFGITVYMTVVEVVVLFMVAVLFGAPVARDLHLVAAVTVLATIGFAVVGSVFAGMLLRTRARELLLPVLLYPVITPALIAGTKGTAALWATTPGLAEAYFWIKFLVVFDAVFLVVSLWAFESLVVE